MRFEIIVKYPKSRPLPQGPVFDSPAAKGLWARSLASDGKNTRSSNRFEKSNLAKTQAKRLVECVDNEDYPASLEKRKIYMALRDAEAERHALLRLIGESGEDYLYPKTCFRSIALPLAVKKAVLAA